MRHNIYYSSIGIPSKAKILKFRIEDDLCAEISTAAEAYIDPAVKCNLLNTKRTVWNLQEQSEFTPTLEKFSHYTLQAIACYLENEASRFTSKFSLKAGFSDAWVAWYSGESFVQPHYHSSGDLFVNDYSLSAYLKVPNKRTSLTFFTDYSNNYSVEVQQGDVLIFPSYLRHYSDDCHEGRTIFSCNFTIAHEKIND